MSMCRRALLAWLLGCTCGLASGIGCAGSVDHEPQPVKRGPETTTPWAGEPELSEPEP